MINQKDNFRRASKKKKSRSKMGEKTEKANTILYMYIKRKVKNQLQKQLRISENYFITLLPGK